MNQVSLIFEMGGDSFSLAFSISFSLLMSNSEHRRIEGLVTLISTEQVEKFAYTLLALLAREKSQEDQNIDACLRELACHVGDAARAQIYDVECNLL